MPLTKIREGAPPNLTLRDIYSLRRASPYHIGSIKILGLSNRLQRVGWHLVCVIVLVVGLSSKCEVGHNRQALDILCKQREQIKAKE